jgi:large subunit ribosomal protein L9
MRVILRENIENLGKKGDIVNVAPGFGRNYLIPKKIALEVTSRNKKMIEIEQKALQKGFEKEKASYQELIDRLNGVTLVFPRKTSEKDVIFGSVSSTDIRDALVAQGFDVEKKKILLEEPIKRLGNYTVPVKIFHEERAEVKLEVVKEGEPRIPEDSPLSPEPEEKTEDAKPESVVEEEGLPAPEEKKVDMPASADEKAPDVLTEAEEEPKSDPPVAEEIFKEEEKPEEIVEPEVADAEKEIDEEPPLGETKKTSEEANEEAEDAREGSPEPEEKTEDADIPEAKSEDKK